MGWFVHRMFVRDLNQEHENALNDWMSQGWEPFAVTPGVSEKEFCYHLRQSDSRYGRAQLSYDPPVRRYPSPIQMGYERLEARMISIERELEEGLRPLLDRLSALDKIIEQMDQQEDR